jgi:anti-sigma factor RsiW
MRSDELEFSISQYLDGLLAAAERDALETRLASDAEARAVFAEYEALQRALATMPLPDVRWDKLAEQISAAVAREEMPAQTFKIGRWLRPARLAMAASVVIGVGIAFSVLRTGPTQNPVATAPISIVVIDSPTAGPNSINVSPKPTIEIAIGPAASTTETEPMVLRYADTVVQRPSKALIVSAAPTVQDNLLTPF